MKSFLQAERDSWFNALFLAMDTVNPSENAEQGHVIQMMTFAESTDCFHCGKLLQVCHNNLEKIFAFTKTLHFLADCIITTLYERSRA